MNVTVVERTQRVIVDDGTILTVESPKVSVVTVGIMGPAGASASSFNHTQSTPSNTWTINHNLGFRPSVELYTVGGSEFDGEVVHVSDNQCIVYLVSSIAGSARCN